MPLQNRLLPTGEIVAIPARGTLTGNRGIIHRADRCLGVSRWSHHAWISCTLEWQGRKRTVMTGRKWTELFFLDEAVAMAAGHRPCGYCRRQAYSAFVAAWSTASGTVQKAKQIDKILHAARIKTGTRQQQRFMARLGDLPSGAMIWWAGRVYLVMSDALHPYQRSGYAPAVTKPIDDHVTVLTPAPLVHAIAAGYRLQLHPSVKNNNAVAQS